MYKYCIFVNWIHLIGSNEPKASNQNFASFNFGNRFNFEHGIVVDEDSCMQTLRFRMNGYAVWRNYHAMSFGLPFLKLVLDQKSVSIQAPLTKWKLYEVLLCDISFVLIDSNRLLVVNNDKSAACISASWKVVNSTEKELIEAGIRVEGTPMSLKNIFWPSKWIKLINSVQ